MSTLFVSPTITRNPRARDIGCLALLAILCLAASLPLFTKYPAPGGDEPGFVDPAITLLHHGYLGTSLFDGLVPSMASHIYWQPPLYFVALAAWFRVLGVGLVQARGFSLACGVLIVWLVYLIARRWAPPAPAAGASALCALSFWLTSRAVFARMDTLCVALSLAGLFVYLSGRRGLAGFLCGLAFITHPLGLIPITTIFLHQAATRRPLAEIAATTAGAAVPCLMWLGYALRDWDAFMLQMGLQFARKQYAPSYWLQFWMARHHAVTLLVAFGAAAWLMTSRRAPRGSSIVALGIALAVAAATYGREAGYFLFFFPLTCVAVAIALSQGHRLLYLALIAAIANEAAISLYNIRRYSHRDYAALSRAIEAAIPPGATVFIGFPDVSPYFALIGRNPVRTAIPVPLNDRDAHARVAAAADFIVSTLPEPYVPGVAALLANKRPVAEIDQGSGYRVAVFANKR